jgi:hypothetical protein
MLARTIQAPRQHKVQMKQKIKLFQNNRSLGVIADLNPADESRLVDLVWTTGQKGLRTTRDGFQYYEELSVDPKSIDVSRMVGNPLLASHDTKNLDSIIGVIESVTIDPIAKEGRASVRFAKDDYSERVFQKVKDKIIRNTSVGYRIDDFKDVSIAGDDIPTFRAEKWTPFEISLVSIGFDSNANIRADEEVTEIELNEKEPQAPIQTEPVAQQIIEERTMTDAEKNALLADAAKKAGQDEKKRQSEIRKAVRAAKLEDSYADELIENDSTADQARAMVIEKLSVQPTETVVKNTTPTIEVSTVNEDKRREGFEESLLNRIDSKNFPMTEQAKPFYGRSLVSRLEIMIPRRPMETDSSYAKRAMSSSDLPLALANVAEKGLQKQYDLQPRTYTQWTREEKLRNYKEFSQVKAGDYNSLRPRAENAEFEMGSFSDKNETAQLKDYGIMNAFSSQMLVNDDLGVIQRMASSAGIAVSRLENKLAYAALTSNKVMKDGIALYHANHANLGTAGAIASASVGEAYKLMRKQTSGDGLDPLNIVPKFFVCGPDKEVEARQFFAAINPNQTSQVNIFQGSMTVIIDAQLTGNQYYFLADPMLLDTVVCFRLEGKESPKIESKIDWDTNSLLLKVDHTFAAEPMDYRGIVKNAGN